jgi:hypothetical protein
MERAVEILKKLKKDLEVELDGLVNIYEGGSYVDYPDRNYHSSLEKTIKIIDETIEIMLS